jgi:hypothetical protein
VRRRASALLTAVLVVGMAVPAWAAPPERERFQEDISQVPAEERVQYDCGGVLLTETGGIIDGWYSVKRMRDGSQQFHWRGQTHNLTAQDEAGNIYRIVGSGGGTAWYAADTDPDDPEEWPTRGHFGLRLVILHEDGGLFGRMFVRGQIMPDGEFRFDQRGDCVEL